MSIQSPLFTVATVSYQSGKWIRQTIESVLASGFKDFELLIFDDHSTDDTWNIVKEYDDPRITAQRNESNIGEYPNRNKLLNEAKGQYILFVDGDDILYRNSLRNLAELVEAFPEAGMLWGLNPQHFPFFVFPYLVPPAMNMNLIYRTNIPIATIGFGEMVFKTALLKKEGFDERFRMGDTHVKKKLAITTSVLYAPIGFIFWRQSLQQASKKFSSGMSAFLERNEVDSMVINDPAFPARGGDKKIIIRNNKISKFKLFVSMTLMKGKIVSFIKYFKKAGFSSGDLFLLLKKGDYSFSPAKSLEDPLYNDYNFKA